MTKLFIAQLCDILNRLTVRKTNNVIDLSTKTAATKTFKLFYNLGNELFGYKFMQKLSELKIKDANDFKDLLNSDEVREMMMNDRQGMFIIKKIKFPTKAEVAKEMKAIYDKYKNNMSKNPDDVDDPIHTYAIRTQFGDGPVVFVDGVKSEEGRKEVRRWYAWFHKINYFQVRECSYDYWLKHPETQESTDRYEYQNDDLYAAEDKMAMDESVNESFNDEMRPRRHSRRHMMDDMKTKRFTKYRKFDDFEDDDFDEFDNDIFDDDFEDDIFESNDREVFTKGDMVQLANSKNDQGYIVIDVLESDTDVENAKKKRNYRKVLPKNFEISSETPALAVMTVKGERGGLNYIYPASDFKHIR